jgi:hypothetical protein
MLGAPLRHRKRKVSYHVSEDHSGFEVFNGRAHTESTESTEQDSADSVDSV